MVTPVALNQSATGVQNSVSIRTSAAAATQKTRRRPIRLDEEQFHSSLDVLRPLEQYLLGRHEMQSVVALGSWDCLGRAQTAGEPVLTNELPQVLWESRRPAQRPSVTQAFPDAAVGAALAPAQLGQLFATY